MQDLGKWFERATKIRLGGGVVSLVARVLICAVLALAFIAWTASLWWVSLIIAGLVFVLCFPMLWRLIDFADRNPTAALFEGAQFLAHEKLRLGTKSHPVLPADSSPKQPPMTQPMLEIDSAQDEAQV